MQDNPNTDNGDTQARPGEQEDGQPVAQQFALLQVPGSLEEQRGQENQQYQIGSEGDAWQQAKKADGNADNHQPQCVRQFGPPCGQRYSQRDQQQQDDQANFFRCGGHNIIRFFS